MLLAAKVYGFSKKLPSSEKYSLVDQMRRAAVSIPANISEGHGRRSDGEFGRFLKISLGSCRELQTHLLLCPLLEYAEPDTELLDACEEVAKMLTSLIKTLGPK